MGKGSLKPYNLNLCSGYFAALKLAVHVRPIVGRWDGNLCCVRSVPTASIITRLGFLRGSALANRMNSENSRDVLDMPMETCRFFRRSMVCRLCPPVALSRQAPLQPFCERRVANFFPLGRDRLQSRDILLIQDR